MLTERGTLAVQMPGRRHTVGLEHAAVHEQQLVACGRQLFDGGAADEPRAAEDGDPQPFSLPEPLPAGAAVSAG